MFTPGSRRLQIIAALVGAAALSSCLGPPESLYVEGGHAWGDGGSFGAWGRHSDVAGSWDGDADWLALGLTFPIRYSEQPSENHEHAHHGDHHQHQAAPACEGLVLERVPGEVAAVVDEQPEMDEESSHAWWKDRGVLDWLTFLIAILLGGERAKKGVDDWKARRQRPQ